MPKGHGPFSPVPVGLLSFRLTIHRGYRKAMALLAPSPSQLIEGILKTTITSFVCLFVCLFSVHMYTYQQEFICHYSRLSSVLDMDTVISQQSLREVAHNLSVEYATFAVVQRKLENFTTLATYLLLILIS